MLYYVSSPTDTALKALTPEMFVEMLSLSEVYRHCEFASRYAHELMLSRERGVALQVAWWERELKREKSSLPCILYQGKPREEDYIGQPGSRHTSKMRSNGKNMLDIDHVSSEEIARILRQVTTVCEPDGTPFVRRVGFVAMTPSGMGLRVVFNGREGSTLVADQQWAAQLLGVTLDECCKDYTRLSFAVPWCNVLYYAPEVLFAECTPYRDAPSTQPPRRPWSPIPPLTTLNSVSPLLDSFALVDELERELGGPPAVGTRNTFVYRMASHLRHLYGDNEEAIFRAIPTYGLTDGERRGAVRSALRRPMGTYVPRCIYRVMNVG